MKQTSQDQLVVAYLLAAMDYHVARREFGIDSSLTNLAVLRMQRANFRAFNPYPEIVMEPHRSYTVKELRELLRRSGIKLK